MIKKWYNTIGAAFAGMMEVSDESILAASNGEVTHFYDEEDEKYNSIEGSIYDAKIFGELLFGKDLKEKEEPMKTGHINLPFPVVNVQYYKGRNPILSRLTGLSMDDLEGVIYRYKYVMVKDDQDLPYMTVNSYTQNPDNVPEGMMTGAEAIEILLKNEEKKEVKNIILHSIPVIPMCMRYIYVNHDGKERYASTDINSLYDFLLIKMDKYIKLSAIENVPKIIENCVKTEVQAAVDVLINNGASTIKNWDYLSPYESLEELYQLIVSTKKPKKYEMPEFDVKPCVSALNTITTYSNENIEDEKMYKLTDPEMVEYDRLGKEVANTLYPFVKDFVMRNYPYYCGLADVITKEVLKNVELAVRPWSCDFYGTDEPEEDYFKMLLEGIANHIKVVVNKQLKWIA